MATVSETSLPPPRHHYRGRVGLVLLLVALALGPVAWIAQLLVDYSVASHACYPDGAPLLDGARVGFWWVLLLVNLIGIVLAMLAGFASWRNYRVAQGDAARERSELFIRVEGRSAFLAGWGGLAGLGFFGGAIFDLIALLAVPPCLG
ncbi:MAG TPA: hypothetical protein VH020_11335 [Stellaceae bacterium]|jgi:hypothetical protein|nr:hypothetical protein [Stellaceae bacterium]